MSRDARRWIDDGRLADHAVTPAGEDRPVGGTEVAVSGRILIRGEAEQDSVLVRLEGRTPHLTTASPGVEGRCSQGVAYLDIVGRIEGPTTQIGRDRVTLAIEAPDAKWARLRQQFARLAGMSASEREDLRGQRRLVPDVREVVVALPHGIVVAGRIRDLSRSGAAVEAGDRVVMGGTQRLVVRTFAGGFAVQFARLRPLERFDPSFTP